MIESEFGSSLGDGRTTSDDLDDNSAAEVLEANGSFNLPGLRAVCKLALLIDSHPPGHVWCTYDVSYDHYSSIGLAFSPFCRVPGNRRSCHYCHSEIEHCMSTECPEIEGTFPIAVASDTDRYAIDFDLRHGLGRIGPIRNCISPFDLECPSGRPYEWGSKIMSNSYL